MKVCSSCGFKMLDNQKYCPRCGLPISFKPPIDTSENIINNDREEKEEKLGIINNAKSNIKRTIIIINIVAIILLGGIILFLTILNNDNLIDKPIVEEKDEELKEVIAYVKSEFTRIMKSKDIVFIKFDNENNRYLFECSHEDSEEQYYYYPDTDEITINVPGMELIINKDFEFKTTFWGEPTEEERDYARYFFRTSEFTEDIEGELPIETIARNKFSNILDYAISPIVEREIDGIEFYLVRANKGGPNYEVRKFLLGSNGEIYDYWDEFSDYWDAVTNKR